MPFVGKDALLDGRLTRHALRTQHRAVFPGVYVHNSIELTLRCRTVAAWLWSGRTAAIAGCAAAAWHGTKWIDDDLDIELVSANTRPPPGIATYNDTLLPDEVMVRSGLLVTTPARTAFDLARRRGRDELARLDALARASGYTAEQVEQIARRHPGARGVRRLPQVLALVDPGAESPRETWLRVLLVEAGFPAPVTQIEVYDCGLFIARLDMGWEKVKVAVEYDGDQHRSDRAQYVRDVRRHELLQRLGWIVIRVVKEDAPAGVVRRVRVALQSRGLS
ncbi:hypothetical protein MANY_34970 [Mycolicibacterium anyangense]|uniref:DUF559 domain-containing protein n=1 Tax=Mycolicibacterium anyangense TaxID=1431246 RepID=A0A6N4W844_9MYCO|nr:DUF559 domain-containing protein [Mycolicibacterium anyangense]BBZ78160.1 hypothetical protein MANY_34970 [Mycolicibacterium anyangense]